MRKILAFLVVTVDGYYEGPNQEFDWPVVDEEFNEFGLEQLEEVDTLLFGRVTYEGWRPTGRPRRRSRTTRRWRRR
jgi:dihydrofolate reductase